MLVQSIRMHRKKTGSFLTIKLSQLTEFRIASELAESKLPGWSVINTHPNNFNLDNRDDAVSEAVCLLREQGHVDSFNECATRLRPLLLTPPLKEKYQASQCDFWQFAMEVWNLYLTTKEWQS